MKFPTGKKAMFGYGMLAGITLLGLAGAAVAPTALDIVMDNTTISTKDPNKAWVHFNKLAFLDEECWFATNAELTTDRPVTDGMVPLRQYFGLALTKFGYQTLTDAERTACGMTPPPAPTTAANGASIDAPNGSLVTTKGTWTFGTATSSGGNALMKDGVIAAGGYGVKLLWINNEIYTYTADTRWFHWTGSSWENIPAEQVPVPIVVSPVPTPTPVPVPVPVVLYYVSINGSALTRPLYDGTTFEATGIWRQLGSETVAVGTACEDAAPRKTTVEYHYTTNAGGKRGLAACSK